MPYFLIFHEKGHNRYQKPGFDLKYTQLIFIHIILHLLFSVSLNALQNMRIQDHKSGLQKINEI